MLITDEIKSIFLEKGENHFDEGSVTQLFHALQCAQHAEIANSSAEMITACLLHDIGHLRAETSIQTRCPCQGRGP